MSLLTGVLSASPIVCLAYAAHAQKPQLSRAAVTCRAAGERGSEEESGEAGRCLRHSRQLAAQHRSKD